MENITLSRTSDDLMQEQNPGISRSIQFMEQNLNRKLTLDNIADEAGYPTSYLTTIFRKNTGDYPGGIRPGSLLINS